MVLTSYRPAYTDEFGEHDEWKTEWEPQICAGFGLGNETHCFVIDRRFGKYIVKECYVQSYWFTNIWGWKLNNGWCITADDYGKKIFRYDELQKAIEICEKKNRLRKVKVVRLS